MPYLELKTNVSITDTKEFIAEFSKISAEILEKPESVTSVSYEFNKNMTFGGSFEPMVQLHITILDLSLELAVKEAYSKSFFEFFQTRLGVSDDRGYIAFVDPGRANLGFRSTTVAELLKQ